MDEAGFYNKDCMEGMKEFPDKFFDLAIVDPPYGIGVFSMTFTNGGKQRSYKANTGFTTKGGKVFTDKRDYSHLCDWDIPPGQEYFDELFRVSQRQIIWGGNYFQLPPSKSWIVWDKRCNDKMTNDFADCELAWMSRGMGVARVCRYLWNGLLQQDMKNKEDRFHPTQKPVGLYSWILAHYAKPGYKILDTHVGSGSSLVACERNGYEYWGYEIDAEYYEKAKKRLDEEKTKIRLF